MEKEKVDDKPVEPERSKFEQAEDAVKRMEEASKRLEAANKAFTYNKQILDAEKVETTLGGQAVAGVENKPVEETPQDYAKKVMAGDVDGKT